MFEYQSLKKKHDVLYHLLLCLPYSGKRWNFTRFEKYEGKAGIPEKTIANAPPFVVSFSVCRANQLVCRITCIGMEEK